MPRPYPHRLALFSLVPLNPRADDVVAHLINENLVSTLKDGKRALDIGHVRPISGNSTTLATLGRNGDVFIEGSSIAKVQCSLSSQVFGENATPFVNRRPRKVVVQKKLNTTIGLGGERRNLIQFELLKWHHHAIEAMEKLKNRESAALEEYPRLARTTNEADTVLPSRREIRPHTAGPQLFQMRYTIIGKQLGSGQFGVVHKAIDADKGKFMAVKILKQPTGASERIMLSNALKREVEMLSRLSHGPWNRWSRTGSLSTLPSLCEAVFDQMLQAIDCLATEGIIHRDVKPENILYVSQSSQYHFQLGDFGLCNRASIAATFAGSPLYMAPEIFQKGGQTHKVDVWLLYVTMLWTLDVKGFRRQSDGFRSVEDAQKVVLSAADALCNIQEMVRVNPEQRASAAQMLVKCYSWRCDE
ncbi:Protein kinase-like domain protein [Metarhizium rileyi]|uniref:non-specific serine/threonine protein kinase n=1 Tax=Metarhizium rileyi (strain RCEF 4871) TaxID=1649241 RepID=A0A166X7Z3_METRR|nr:Protein kinase-like domain protein [Metarhizium rileyi RCEF 4871]